MLTADELRLAQRRRRPPPSLKQQYQEYVMQRVESYKNSIPRDELLRLGDEAVSELADTQQGQFVLTEVLMLDSVDRLIIKRLKLRPYRRWRQQFLDLRAAQREATHWGLEPSCLVARLLPRIESGDHAIVIGTGGEQAAYLLAAHDVGVTFIANDLGCVERVEQRLAGESLSTLCDAYVVQLGGWLPAPGGPVAMVVVDTACIADVAPDTRIDVLRALQTWTVPSGVHVLLAGTGLAPAGLRSFYDGWEFDEVVGERPTAADLALSRRGRPRTRR